MTIRTTLTVLLLVALHQIDLVAQVPTFDSGSDGSYGAMTITENTTLPLPEDGVFHCTTVTIQEGKTLKFTKNAKNTPVYILATGDVLLEGRIDIEGQGPRGTAGGESGPGGFNGGRGGETRDPAGSGHGPGGGEGGSETLNGGIGGPGAYRFPQNYPGEGSTYGNSLIIPLVGGSGAGGTNQVPTTTHYRGQGGAGGGGAILIASNTRVIFGGSSTGPSHINARGGTGNPPWTHGSGGAVRIVAPRVEGTTKVQVKSYSNNDYGAGRFRIDAYDRSDLSIRASANDGFSAPDAVGSVMVVFPDPMPKLWVSSIAGRPIAEDTAGSVSILLPAGTNPSQSIKVSARDFGSIVPTRIRLVPDTGPAVVYDTTIDNTVNDPAEVTVPVTIPVNTGVSVEISTR